MHNWLRSTNLKIILMGDLLYKYFYINELFLLKTQRVNKALHYVWILQLASEWDMPSCENRDHLYDRIAVLENIRENTRKINKEKIQNREKI